MLKTVHPRAHQLEHLVAPHHGDYQSRAFYILDDRQGLYRRLALPKKRSEWPTKFPDDQILAFFQDALILLKRDGSASAEADEGICRRHGTFTPISMDAKPIHFGGTIPPYLLAEADAKLDIPKDEPAAVAANGEAEKEDGVDPDDPDFWENSADGF